MGAYVEAFSTSLGLLEIGQIEASRFFPAALTGVIYVDSPDRYVRALLAWAEWDGKALWGCCAD